jgi:RNA polymerase sigma-B factor
MTRSTSPQPPSNRNRSAHCGPLPDKALRQRNLRVQTYRQLVRPIALHYSRCSSEACDDLTQVGLLGLIRAAELYCRDRSVPFESFARPHIRGAILHYLRDTAPCVRLPRRQAELQEKLSRLERQQLQGLGGPATPAELRRQLGVSAQQWSALQQQRQLRRPCSLAPDQLELVAAPCTDPPEDEAGAASEVEAMLAILEPRQRLVVRQVVLAGWSYRRLGEQMQVSPMTVQRLLRAGLDRLRLHLAPVEVTPGARADHEPSAAPAC